ncbi:RNA polymerase sigma-70 factor (ECF subfamily) [Allocatelliglobosispora scoriae]|uniref:RNA polymerase sigma-70 factor (ECF subfamily) n=1 Tax=Allocatelliglobosispora scoriae TaxID=643052 RepID=A0A841BN23_9ACTN|nr:sigma-70 family RNA polymerase sigma factor [Allocatelliglobosispora scoriae]MBB5868589.1 RNA polymerase sigma-70 factor (ECF subfamily) [Allocatelliglobosispora scoriae]
MSGECTTDAQWFDQLWKDHNQSLYRYCLHLVHIYLYRGRTGSFRSEAADLAQLTFASAWEKRESIRCEEKDPGNWLRNTARNHVRNLSRRSSHTKESPSDNNELVNLDGTTLEDTSPGPEYSEIWPVLRELSIPDRELLILTYWADLSIGQLAQLYGISDAAVRARQTRARSRFRDALEASGMTHLIPSTAATHGDNNE